MSHFDSFRSSMKYLNSNSSNNNNNNNNTNNDDSNNNNTALQQPPAYSISQYSQEEQSASQSVTQPITVNPSSSTSNPLQQQQQQQQQQMDFPIKISLRTLSGQIMVVPLQSLAGVTVLQLKQRVEEIHNIPAQHQRLIFSGRELEDDKMCTEYNLADGMMIHLLLRQIPRRQTENQSNQQPQQIHPSNFPVAAAIAIPIQNQFPPQQQFHFQGNDDFNLVECLGLSRTLRLFAIIDTVFLILWSIYIWPLIFLVLLTVAGYHGALKYNRNYMILFAIYLVLSIAARVTYIVFFYSPIVVLLLGIGILIELWILKLTIQFIRLISNLTEQDKQQLIELQRVRQAWV